MPPYLEIGSRMSQIAGIVPNAVHKNFTGIEQGGFIPSPILLRDSGTTDSHNRAIEECHPLMRQSRLIQTPLRGSTDQQQLHDSSCCLSNCSVDLQVLQNGALQQARALKPSLLGLANLLGYLMAPFLAQLGHFSIDKMKGGERLSSLLR